MGQVVMAIDRSGWRTMPTGTAGSPTGCRGCARRQGWSRGRSTRCAQHRGEATEWKEEERVRKNGGRIVWEILYLRLGVPRTLVGIGADAAPAGQRPGPILSPGADFSSFTSEPDLARTRAVIIE